MKTTLVILAAFATAAAAQPVVTNFTTSVYATVPDPLALSFGADGALYVGRDNSGSGGGSGDAVKIHRVAPGGSPVTEFGNAAIPDPDAVIVDQAGMVSGTPGSVLVGGAVSGSSGRVSKIAPDGTVIDLFGTSTDYDNPTGFAFDAAGRLFFTTYGNGRVYRADGGVPTNLFALTQANSLEVDALGRLAVNANNSTALRLYSLDGALLNAGFATVLAGTPIARAPGGLWGTNLVVVGASGQLLRLNADGTTTVLGGGFSAIADLRFGPDGALYASDFSADRIYRFGEPLVPGAVTTVYARVTDPVRLSFTPDGTLFVGRDNTGSGGDFDDPVKIHRIGPGGSPVEEFGNAAIPDPDGVLYDEAGQGSGIPGAVMVAGRLEGSIVGQIVAIRPDQTIATLYGPTTFSFNPNAFVWDLNGRLLLTDDEGGRVWVVTNGVPAVLFNLPGVLPLAADSLNRLVVGLNGGTTLRLYTSAGTLLTNAFATTAASSPLLRGPGGFWGTGVFCMAANGDLLSLDTNGVPAKFGSGFGLSHGMAFGPDGALYVSEFNSDLIWRVAPNTGPRLTARHSGGDVVVSWPLPADGWLLESATNLAVTPIQWVEIPPPYQTNGTNLQFVEPSPNGNQFFRLHKP